MDEVPLFNGRSLNHKLVKAGLVWWSRQYAPKDTTLVQLEAEARTAKCGLWVDAHSIPPREWRRETHVAPAASPGAVSATASANAAGEVYENKHSKVYCVPGCKGYAGMNPASVVPFASEAAAQ